MNILVSACLVGVCCRYNGCSVHNDKVAALIKAHTLVPVCPEQLGGLSTPRPPAEIQGSRVMTVGGQDVTAFYTKGAEETLHIARLCNCRLAILKAHSPSCGSVSVYDGSFSGTRTDGDGITAKLLRTNGIIVACELDELEQLDLAL